MVKKNFEDMCNRLERIPACEGQTDGRTDRQISSCHGIVRDSNSDFRINPDSDPDICRMAPKMLYLISVIRFAKCSENRLLTV